MLLLDEPLGALDLKLRQDMQYELIRLKNELGITFVYVTHDQEEALTMSDTIVVMNQGYIQQIGTPEDIYNEPQNAFVADLSETATFFLPPWWKIRLSKCWEPPGSVWTLDSDATNR